VERPIVRNGDMARAEGADIRRSRAPSQRRARGAGRPDPADRSPAHGPTLSSFPLMKSEAHFAIVIEPSLVIAL
jgi:hypothetical protein